MSQRVNAEILDLWRNTAHQCGTEAILNRAPKFVAEPTSGRCRLAFVGLNPSFRTATYLGREPGFQQFLDAHPELEYPDHFDWTASPLSQGVPYPKLEGIIDAMAQLHVEARHWYPWFTRINAISNAIGVPVQEYAHLDIYLWLSGKSGDVGSLITKFPDLARAQERMFLRLLSVLRPERIVCVYAGVADRLRQLLQTKEANGLGIGLTGPFEPVGEDVFLKRTSVTYPERQQAPVFSPIRRALPKGRFSMNDEQFARVSDYIMRYP